MYRVLLIDDENIIVEGLRRVIRWADYNCQVVGTAYVPFPWAYILKKFIILDPNRYRAVPNGVSIIVHPGTHWQRGLPAKFQFADESRSAYCKFSGNAQS